MFVYVGYIMNFGYVSLKFSQNVIYVFRRFKIQGLKGWRWVSECFAKVKNFTELFKLLETLGFTKIKILRFIESLMRGFEYIIEDLRDITYTLVSLCKGFELVRPMPLLKNIQNFFTRIYSQYIELLDRYSVYGGSRAYLESEVKKFMAMTMAQSSQRSLIDLFEDELFRFMENVKKKKQRK